MKRIILCGCLGKMGRVITSLTADRSDCKIVAGVDLNSDTADFPLYSKLDEVKESADVIIDFSRPELLTDILGYAAEHPGVSCVLCTTGYSAEQVEVLTAASKTLPIFYSRNMSLGINLLVELSKKAAKVLGSEFLRMRSQAFVTLILYIRMTVMRSAKNEILQKSEFMPFAAARSSVNMRLFLPAIMK